MKKAKSEMVMTKKQAESMLKFAYKKVACSTQYVSFKDAVERGDLVSATRIARANLGWLGEVGYKNRWVLKKLGTGPIELWGWGSKKAMIIRYIALKGELKDGLRTGVWNHFNVDGIIIKTELYEKDK